MTLAGCFLVVTAVIADPTNPNASTAFPATPCREDVRIFPHVEKDPQSLFSMPQLPPAIEDDTARKARVEKMKKLGVGQ